MGGKGIPHRDTIKPPHIEPLPADLYGRERIPPPLRPSEEFLVAAEEAALAEIAHTEALLKKTKAAVEGITPAAYIMRERRAKPDKAAQGRLEQKARDTAYRRLARRHPDEYLSLIQQERAKLALPVMQPKARKVKHKRVITRAADTEPPKPEPVTEKVRAPQAVLHPVPLEVQAACRHNMGLQKLPYGTFCVECGAKIR